MFCSTHGENFKQNGLFSLFGQQMGRNVFFLKISFYILKFDCSELLHGGKDKACHV